MSPSHHPLQIYPKTWETHRRQSHRTWRKRNVAQPKSRKISAIARRPSCVTENSTIPVPRPLKWGDREPSCNRTHCASRRRSDLSRPCLLVFPRPFASLCHERHNAPSRSDGEDPGPSHVTNRFRTHVETWLRFPARPLVPRESLGETLGVRGKQLGALKQEAPPLLPLEGCSPCQFSSSVPPTLVLGTPQRQRMFFSLFLLCYKLCVFLVPFLWICLHTLVLLLNMAGDQASLRYGIFL